MMDVWSVLGAVYGQKGGLVVVPPWVRQFTQEERFDTKLEPGEPPPITGV